MEIRYRFGSNYRCLLPDSNSCTRTGIDGIAVGHSGSIPVFVSTALGFGILFGAIGNWYI